jgi:UDP-4-amino-4-deoxy-L-arabinose formyltransferase/UDP-glucuronic acid dehydrogenase (UDP-4-keto-hexauronic acid decarboxylating)
MRAVVLGYHDIGCVGIEALLRHGFEIAAVFTHADDPAETVWFRSVAELAARKGLAVFAPDDINHPIWVQRIADLKPDVILSFYYRRLVKEPLLAIPRAGGLNLHGSLLPKYRGRAPVNWALVNGETRTGVTLHYMTPRADDGDIVAQRVVPIGADDNARTLMGKMAEAAGLLLDDALPQLKAGRAPRTPQDASQATTFGRRRPEDGEIDWTKDAPRLANLVRAVTRPYPGAFTYSGRDRLLVWEAQAVESPRRAVPGTILSTNPLDIACGSGALRVQFGQRDGGIYRSGPQLAEELGLVEAARLGPAAERRAAAGRKKRVLILGVNGFIGNALGRRLLDSGQYEVHGMDLNDNAIRGLESNPDFHFHEGDISIHSEWIQYHIKKCDIVVPLVAIATPIEYTRNPLRVFELDFEENLKIVRYCAKYRKRIIFPSTS